MPNSTDTLLPMLVGSLFSGVGGIDLGLERAGMRVLWQVEYDKYCQSVLRHRFTGTELYNDVREVGPDLAPVDLICGGFPCQDVSVAGNRAGLTGERSGLWHEFHRIIGEIMPRWVLIENVPGLLSSNGGRDLAVVLSGLAQFGYGWAYRILDSQYFGVPQRRRRVFIIGCLGDAGAAFRALHPVGTSLPGHPPPSRETRSAITPILASGAANAGGLGVSSPGSHMFTLDTTGAQAVVDTGAAIVTQEGTTASTQVSIDGSGIAGPLDSHYWKGPGSRAGGERDIVAQSVPRRLTVAPSITASNNPSRSPQSSEVTQQVQAMVEVTSVPRRLTPRECERLQGFPDDWTLVEHNGKPMSDGQRYRQMGNAVTVSVAEWIGRRILEEGGEG